MNLFGARVWLVFLLVLLPGVTRAHEHDAQRPNDSQCYHAVAYSAPSGCPDAASLEQRLGTGYHVERATLANCPQCVRAVVIEGTTETRGYRMHIAGLESTTVTRLDCNELAEFAAYAIEASDLPPPVCTKTSAFVGVSATPLMNLSNGDPLLASTLRVTIPIGKAELTPFAVWLPQADVRNQVARDGRNLNPDWENLSLQGYGAGADVCWPLFNDLFGFGQDSVLHLCGTGIWRRFTATPAIEGASVEAELWTVGGSIGWRASLFEAFHMEAAPTLLVGLGDAATYQSGTSDRLYQYGGLEAQLRVGFSWEFIVRKTPTHNETFRSPQTSSQPSVATLPHFGHRPL
jgi:hypothetical protein